VDVHAPEAGRGENVEGKNASIRGDERNVRTLRTRPFTELARPELRRLNDRQSELESPNLHGRCSELQTSTSRLVGLADDAEDFREGVQRVEGWNGEGRRAEEKRAERATGHHTKSAIAILVHAQGTRETGRGGGIWAGQSDLFKAFRPRY
jgi:hypothetical protein